MMLVSDLSQSGLAIYLVWVSCVKYYVVPTAIENASVWTYTAIPLFTSFSGLFVHIFLAKRILDLTQKKLMGCCLMFLGLASCGLGSATGIFGLVKSLSVSQIVNGSPPYQTLACVWLSVQVALNLILAGSLIYIYDKMGEKILNILPQFAKAWVILVKCNVFGTLFSLLTLILVVSSPKSSTWLVLLVPLGRVYSATVLTWLLARDKSQDMQTRSFHGTSKMQWRVPASGRFSRSQNFKVIQIKTEREVIVESSAERSSGSKDPDLPLPDASDEEIRVMKVPNGSQFNKKRIPPEHEC